MEDQNLKTLGKVLAIMAVTAVARLTLEAVCGMLSLPPIDFLPSEFDMLD